MTNYIIEAIKTRRSIRSYSGQAVPKETIEAILDAGRMAPSSLNTQPWKFVVITDKKLIDEISSSIKSFLKKVYALLPILSIFIKELRDEKVAGAIRKTATAQEDAVLYSAPLLILIVSDKKDRWTPVNCALAAQNMMLAAHSLGIGSCFIGRVDIIKKYRRFFQKLGIERKYSIQASLIFGYPKEFPKNIPERKKDNIISWK